MRTDDVKSRQVFPKFDMGDVVYHKADKDRKKGIVVGWEVRPGLIKYLVAWGSDSSDYHYDMELTTVFEPDYGSNVDE